ncbi:MAG TPA: LacI family transcriptional regulator [Firmicutes bacterium]|nr:LacI family transcriptional regulator [Bacillota bacterium]
MKKVNLADIAAALNISQSTVSRALRNKPGVNPQLREEVFKMAQALNYPFPLPKSPAMKRVGIIIPDLSNPFFATVCYGIESVMRSNGYFTYLVNTDEDWELENSYLQSFIDDDKVEGLIIAPSANTERIYNDLLGTLPFIFFDRYYDALNVQSVIIDNEGAVFRATQYLVETGHTNICFVAGSDNISTGRSRTRGFLEAINLLGLDREKCAIVDGDFKEPKSYEGAKRILAEGECTAVIATSNKTTWGVMRAVRDLRLSIPGDVNVIGFDSQDWTEFSDNPIATIVQPAFTMGNLAASLLLQQINGREFSSENVVLKAEIKNSNPKLSISL